MNRSRLLLTGLVVVSALLVSGCSGESTPQRQSPSAEPLDLKLMLEEGRSYTFQQISEDTNSEGTDKSDVLLKAKVLKKVGSAYDMEITFAEPHFDSDSMSQEVIQQITKHLLGLTISARFTERGVPETVKASSDDLFTKLFLNVLNSGFTGITFKDAPVKVGDKWSRDIEIAASGGSITPKSQTTIPVQLELESIGEENGKKVARIAISADGRLEFEGKQAGKDALTIVHKTKMSGSATVDVATGLIISSVRNTDSIVEIGGREMVQKSKLTTTLK